jgi:Spy/CpxP family protein refolding chaperone
LPNSYGLIEERTNYKTMKKLLIAASALLLIAGSAQAQSTQKDSAFRKHQRDGVHHKQGMGMKDLNLTDAQKKQFKDLNESYRKQATDLRNDKSLSADQLKAKTQSLRKEQYGKMQTILTDEQKAKFAAQRKQGGQKGMYTRGDKQARGRNFEQMKTKLGLTDAQSAKLKANGEEFRNKAKAIRDNNSLSQEQKKEQVKALAQQNRENMKSILTPEQMEKLKAGRKNKMGSK